MDIGALLALHTPGNGIAQTAIPTGFEALLADMVSMLAPPGLPPPIPPAVQPGGEELKTCEPNAQSTKPDLSPEINGRVLFGFAAPENELVAAFLKGAQLPSPAAEPFEQAFQRLLSDPYLNVKMVRVDLPAASEGLETPLTPPISVEKLISQMPLSAPVIQVGEGELPVQPTPMPLFSEWGEGTAKAHPEPPQICVKTTPEQVNSNTPLQLEEPVSANAPNMSGPVPQPASPAYVAPPQPDLTSISMPGADDQPVEGDSSFSADPAISHSAGKPVELSQKTDRPQPVEAKYVQADPIVPRAQTVPADLLSKRPIQPVGKGLQVTLPAGDHELISDDPMAPDSRSRSQVSLPQAELETAVGHKKADSGAQGSVRQAPKDPETPFVFEPASDQDEGNSTTEPALVAGDSSTAREVALLDRRARPDEPRPSAPNVGERTALDSRLESGRLRDLVTDRADTLASIRARESVTVHLEPFDLGGIKLIVRQLEGRVETEVFAEDDRVRQALQGSHVQLGQSFEQRGLRLEQFSVSTPPGSSDGQSQGHRECSTPFRHTPTAVAERPRSDTRRDIAGPLAGGVDLSI